MAVLLKPPIGEVFGEPARSAFGRKIPVDGRVDDGDAELGLDRVESSTDGVGVDAGGQVVIIYTAS